jgi:aldose 1-epimerase
MSALPPSGVQHRIRAGDHAAVVVELGGGVRTYTVAERDVLDGYAEDELPPAGAGQILAPWPNRIRDGRYRWHGTGHQLALSEPAHHNAMHGLVRWLPWRPASVTGAAVTLDCRLEPHPGYPWRLLLATTWSVGPAGLRAEHTATNLADTPAPFGLGAHPYLLPPGGRVDDAVLTVPADRRLLVDGRRLPLGAAALTGTDWDYTRGRRIGSAVLDTAFGGGPRGSAVIVSTVDGSAQVTLWADEAFGWWQVFTGDGLAAPRTRRAVGVEPMTCPPDAYRSDRDVVTLEPGATWRGSWGVTPGAA